MNVRLAIVLSTLWVAAVAGFLVWEYMTISVDQCVFPPDKLLRELGFDPSVQKFFLSCNVFSDIPTHWWGTITFWHGKQVFQLSTFRLMSTTTLPIIAIWFVLAICPALWRWVANGRSAST